MTAISSRGPPAPRRMTEPLPNCRSICEIASSRACRRSFLASAMRVSLQLSSHAHCTFRSLSLFGHSRWAFSQPSMSGVQDRAPEPYRGQLGVTRSLTAELASHEECAGDPHLAEFAGGPAGERLGERGVGAGLAHPTERDVGRKGPLLARESERGERRVDPPREVDHLRGALRHPGPDDTRPACRRKGAEPKDARLEGADVHARLAQRARDGVDPLLGHRAEELEREVQIAGRDPRNVTRRRTQPLDHLAEHATDRVVEQDRDERANAGYRGASRSRSRLRMPCCRSGSGSTASAARRSASAPAWSPWSSFSRPRAASARESSGTGAGAGAGGTAATSCGGAGAGALSDRGDAGAVTLGAASDACVELGLVAGACVAPVVDWAVDDVAAAAAAAGAPTPDEDVSAAAGAAATSGAVGAGDPASTSGFGGVASGGVAPAGAAAGG